MALTFKEISSFELTTAELKADVKAMGKKIAAKEEMSFFLVTNYLFKDKKTGILLMIGKSSECKNAFKLAKAFANGAGKKLAGTPLASIIIKKSIMWGTAKYVTDEVTGATCIEFEKQAGMAKPSLIMKQLEKNPWIKAQEFECRFTGSEEEIEGTDEIEGEQPTTEPTKVEATTKPAPQVGNLGGYYTRILTNYAELQKTKSKDVATKVKDDSLKFQEFFNLALPEEKTQFKAKADQVTKILQNLGVSTGNTAAAVDTPERKAAKEQNKITKAKIDELLKSVNLDELYKMATA
jgi:hypothetical protein